MAITSAFKQFQRNLSPGRSLSDIGFGVGGMEGLPKRMETGLATAPLQRQATGTGGGGMVPGATNIMMPLANLAAQAGTQQYGNPFAGATYNFPVVQPAQTIGATYNITMPDVTPAVAKKKVTVTPSGGGETVRESQARRRTAFAEEAKTATGAEKAKLTQKARTI